MTNIPIFEFENKLDHIIGKWIFDKNSGLPSNAEHKTVLLSFVSSIYALLHDATSVFVTGHLHYILLEMIVDELLVLVCPSV